MKKIKDKIRYFLYKFFGKLIFELKVNKRKRERQKIKRKQYKPKIAFKKLEKSLQGIKYPSNDFNKVMSMLLSDIENFEYIVRRFRYDRKILSYIAHDDQVLYSLHPNKRFRPAHPPESDNNRAIKIDVQSLFMFGMIMINRSLLLLKMYLPDRSMSTKKDKDMYSKIGNLYYKLSQSNQLSALAQKFKDSFLKEIKWLYAVLRFYRNEFIEHLDRCCQQGMKFGIYTDDFSLSSYKWNYNIDDDIKIEEFRAKLEKSEIKIVGRSDGGRRLINRYYIQMVFNNIVSIPRNLLKEALDLIEDIGVNSPKPEEVISKIEKYMTELFNFMVKELKESELIKYKSN